MSNTSQDFKCKHPVTHAEAKAIIARQLEDRRRVERLELDRRAKVQVEARD